jgi:hypothetical protein
MGMLSSNSVSADNGVAERLAVMTVARVRAENVLRMCFLLDALKQRSSVGEIHVS